MARTSSPSPSKLSIAKSTKTQSAAQADTEFATVRLHITPLTPETTASLLPQSVLDEAARQTLSYHTVETFPENSYAFLNLPKDQAEKLKKKLNGSVFRGAKVRVSEARPETWKSKPGEPKMEHVDMTEKKRREERREKRKSSKVDGEPKIKKRKKGEDGTLEGIELPEGRRVQRGWTKPTALTTTSPKYAGKSASSDMKSANKSDDDSKRECLFKTPLPSNRAIPKDDKKKDKDEKKDKKKRKRDVIVKEFKNNTKFPQFLKVSQLDKDKAADTMANEYVEGVGWVNAKGELVEEAKIKKRAATIAQMEVDTPETAYHSISASSSGNNHEDEVMIDNSASNEEESVSAESSGDSNSGVDLEPEEVSKTHENSESDSSSDSSSDSGSDAPFQTGKISPITPITPITPIMPVKRTLSSSSATSPKVSTPTLQITIPAISTTPVQIHPLEALYKPTATKTSLLQVGVTASPASASAEGGAFKFGFGAGYDSDAEEAEPVVQTPYRERYRSAAPTPDTAVGHRKFFPDDGDMSNFSAGLGFVPSTPRIVGGFPGGQDLLARRGSASFTPTSTESPLLFPHSESRFLGALSVWSKLPTPKTLTPTGEESVAADEQEQREKKGKTANETTEEDNTGEKTPIEVWNEKFYEKRGEWNRAWKGRRREVLKQKRKREAATGPSGTKRIAT